MLFIIILAVVCIGGCWWVFKGIGEAVFGEKEDYSFTDKSVHHHYHFHEHKNINIIDEQTRKNVYQAIDEKKAAD